MYVETEYMANQARTNEKVLVTAGIKTNLPWSATRSILWNKLIKAPISPEFSLAARHENRIENDPLTNAGHANKQSSQVFMQMAWNPIYLFSRDEVPSTKDITLQLVAKGWYFPNEDGTTPTTARKREGRFDASVLVPIERAGDFLSKATAPNTAIRFSYGSGANEANGYQHSKEFKIGIELIQ
jgi:hypothetical protein